MKVYAFDWIQLISTWEDICAKHGEDWASENIPWTPLFSGGIKCGGCNWPTSSLYVRAETREEAVQLLRDGDAGMCGECFAEMLSMEEATQVLGED